MSRDSCVEMWMGPAIRVTRCGKREKFICLHVTLSEEEKESFSGSLYDFLKVELTRGYILENDEERYSARRQKIHTFMKIPREVECFIWSGVMQCADSFLYIHTFLPVRYLLAVWAVIYRSFRSCFGLRRSRYKLLTPAEVCDLLKGSIWLIVTAIMIYGVDNNRIYHIIKTQSIIKLYIFYNMLEVGDRLLSAFGQDAIDSLFWTATEPKTSRRQSLGLIPHFLFAFIYVVVHSGLIIFQATTLNVAVNSNNKGLLTIMMSNNFVELKGSVFKKFDKNNLFQLTCSDVRERFHLFVLMLIVIIQTMKEFNWASEQFVLMLPDCLYVLVTEVIIDALKHAFITRFNELPLDVYKEYKLSLAYDMTQTRQKHAFSDHSDLVARRMGFIPFPLSIVLMKALYHAVTIDSLSGVLLLFMAYFIFVLLRILNTIVGLGFACDLMKQHQAEKSSQVSPQTPVSVNHSVAFATTASNRQRLTSTTAPVIYREANEPPNMSTNTTLGATALFSNSDVDLDDVCLNETLLNETKEVASHEVASAEEDFNLTRSVPDLLQHNDDDCDANKDNDVTTLEAVHKEGPSQETGAAAAPTHGRTHRRSESEPFIQSAILEAVVGAKHDETSAEK